MGKNCCNTDAFSTTFWVLLKLFIMIIDSLKKLKSNLAIILNIKHMNNLMKKLLVTDKFMPELHLKQLLFTQSARGTFTEDKERIQKFKRNTRLQPY